MQTDIHPLRIYWLSEKAVTIEFGKTIDEGILQQIHNFNEQLNKRPFQGYITSVPAYATLSVFYDPLQVMASDLPGEDCFSKVSQYLNDIYQKVENAYSEEPLPITIPVCYGGDFGVDIDEVAKHNKLSAQQVIQLHTAGLYKVYMIGFVPGFAYMGGMDEQIATPRKSMPDKAIPAGSVGIAGVQTGIYPLVTPGGWQVIGQTPLKMFDACKPQPALLKAGDNVVFKAISREEFETLAASQ